MGIDPSIPNQELLFLMNVPMGSIAGAQPGDTYTTRIFMNPNIFQSVSSKGLDVVAYNSVTSKW